MDLRFTPEENAFRDEVRAFFKANLPDDIRKKAAEGIRYVKDDIVTWQRILNKKGWAVPHWPKEWGGTGWSPVQLYIFKEEMQQAPAPEPLPFGAMMVGPVIIAFGREDQKKQVPAAHRQSRRLVVPGLLRAGRGLRPRLAEDAARSATATTTSSTARRPGPRCAQYADWIFCLVRTDPAAKKQEGIIVPADRHEDAGHHGAADPDHRRQPRGQRGVLRRREGAGREPHRRGEQGLGLRQVPARQRALRHRARRRLEGAGAAAARRSPRWSASATSR